MEMIQAWQDEFSFPETLEIACKLARYEAELSGYHSQALCDLIDRRDWDGLLSFDLQYDRNLPVMDYVHARQALGFFEKLEPLGEILGVDREAAAYQKFLDSEKTCSETNEFFELYRRGRLCLTPTFERVLYAARWKIEKMLGVAPRFRDIKPKLGPGACTTVKRRNAAAADKLSSTLACSVNFIPYLPLWVAANPQLVYHHSSHKEDNGDDVWTFSILEDTGTLTFVEKDAKSYRSIVVEPILSSMYQLGLGDVIAKRLRKNGIDITNQTTNQNLARYGSVSGALATLDLSAASDSISRELVRFLLPDDWYSLLDGFRSPTVKYKGEPIALSKFSSMGNGSTFPLETLIFYALTWASSPHRERCYINAYGDDIICGSGSAEAVIQSLQCCGFAINTRKSYTTGPFRESCGADYYNGVDIRPYRLKALLTGENLFTMHNFFKRQYRDDLCDQILKLIGPQCKLWGPDGYGDGHLITESPPKKRHGRDKGYGGYTFDTFVLKSRRSTRVHPGDYLHVLYSVYVRGEPEMASAITTTHQTEEQIRKLMNASLPRYLSGIDGRPVLSDIDGNVVKTYPLTSVKKCKRISIYTLAP